MRVERLFEVDRTSEGSRVLKGPEKIVAYGKSSHFQDRTTNDIKRWRKKGN